MMSIVPNGNQCIRIIWICMYDYDYGISRHQTLSMANQKPFPWNVPKFPSMNFRQVFLVKHEIASKSCFKQASKRCQNTQTYLPIPKIPKLHTGIMSNWHVILTIENTVLARTHCFFIVGTIVPFLRIDWNQGKMRKHNRRSATTFNSRWFRSWQHPCGNCLHLQTKCGIRYQYPWIMKETPSLNSNKTAPVFLYSGGFLVSGAAIPFIGHLRWGGSK